MKFLPLIVAAFCLSNGSASADLFGSLFHRGPEIDTTGLGQIVAVSQPQPVGPTYAVPPAPGGGAYIPHYAPQPIQPIGLYGKVKYKDFDNIHPCGVKQIVAVLDPCQPPPDPCADCPQQPAIVFVEVCIPPGPCPDLKVTKNGRKIELDYGEYEVEIRTKRDYVEVDYDD
ncbi:hypothetical protein [Stratiformator vulcanicus]|uniref:Uncharacterized protein n=1 Tax=Stratiformator vulcanicus TaxID=2527980 RepID=A0A517R058_9PLAN|nr:hypothetical protein [Stratiformator vulcanicus]QDT37279.1 hypothetical protein Pan189_16520 [Stratiformator vulcanicus]